MSDRGVIRGEIEPEAAGVARVISDPKNFPGLTREQHAAALKAGTDGLSPEEKRMFNSLARKRRG